ncbi:MAG: hypothetical protein RSB61_06525 [Clostridia bacterium]
MKNLFSAQFYALRKNKLVIWGVVFLLIAAICLICAACFVPTGSTETPPSRFDKEATIKNLELTRAFALWNIYTFEGKPTDEIYVPPGSIITISSSYFQAKKDFAIADFWLKNIDRYAEYLTNGTECKLTFPFGNAPASNATRGGVMMNNVVSISLFFFLISAVLLGNIFSHYDFSDGIAKNYYACNVTFSQLVRVKTLIATLVYALVAIAPIVFVACYGSITPDNLVLIYANGKAQLVSALTAQMSTMALYFTLGWAFLVFSINIQLLVRNHWKTLLAILGVFAGCFVIGALWEQYRISAPQVLLYIPIYNIFSSTFIFSDWNFWLNLIGWTLLPVATTELILWRNSRSRSPIQEKY